MPPGAIDVGGTCIDRNSVVSLNSTVIDRNNPANLSGTITNVCIYCNKTEGYNWYIGIFYLVSGTTYHCRSAYGPFTVSAGINNISVNMAIQAGDFIGVYSYSATLNEKIEDTSSGMAGICFLAGNHCVVDNEGTYDCSISDDCMSLYGTGATPPTGVGASLPLLGVG